MTEEEPRRVLGSVDLRSDDSTSVSESESQTHRGGPERGEEERRDGEMISDSSSGERKGRLEILTSCSDC